MKTLLLLLFSLLLASCESVSPAVHKEVEEKPVIEYKPTDTIGVKEAKETLANNAKKRLELVKRGAKRSDDFEPLILSLIAFHNYDQELKLSDVSPFMKELPHIASISTHQEKEEFIRLGTADKISVKKLGDEAEKGVINNEADKLKDKKIIELQDKLDSKVTETTSAIAEKFFYLGGLLFVGSLFSSFSLIAPIAGKLKNGGLGLLLVGGIIMLFGTFTDFIREFLDEYGNWLLLLLLIPLILLFIGRKADKAIDEIKSDDIND